MKLIECTTCGSLEEVQSAIDCTLVYHINKKYNALVYNLDCCFDDRLYRDLLRYKRILQNRLYDAVYPCSDIAVDKIVTQAALLALPDDCNRCTDCDIDILSSTTTTTSTSTTTTSTTTTTTSYPSNCSRYRLQVNPEVPVMDDYYSYSYTPCIDRAPIVTGLIKPTEVIDFCCVPGSIVIDPVFNIILINSICIP